MATGTESREVFAEKREKGTWSRGDAWGFDASWFNVNGDRFNPRTDRVYADQTSN